MRHDHRTGFAVLALIATATAATAADFEPPKDGKLTDKQVVAAIAVVKEQMDAVKAAGNATAGSTSGAANLAVAARMSQKIDAAVTKSGLSKPEYEWVSEQLGTLWPVATLQQQWDDSGKPDLERQIKLKRADVAAAQAKQAQYEAAAKAGKRVLTKEQLDAAVASAKSDREAAAANVTAADDAVKAIEDEAKGHDKEAADADALAKSPPADVSAEDRASYVDGKKTEAQTARDAAKESRAKLPEARRAVADARAAVAVIDGRIAHPEVPTTDDERAAVKAEDEQGIADAKAAADSANQAVATLQDALSAGPPIGGAEPKLDADNLALMRKHIKDYWAAIGMADPSAKK